jgi:hypothetical protein
VTATALDRVELTVFDIVSARLFERQCKLVTLELKPLRSEPHGCFIFTVTWLNRASDIERVCMMSVTTPALEDQASYARYVANAIVARDL